MAMVLYHTIMSQQFERGQSAQTRTSQAPLIVECSLPVTTSAASSKYRSANDPSNQIHKRFLLVDTPGHGKLRHYAIDSIIKPQNLKGIIFMVDAADISLGSTSGFENGTLRQSAEYLHDVLLLLQKRALNTKSPKGATNLPLMVIANKLDLFTALPTPLVKAALEAEISNVRNSRNKGLLDSGVGMNDMDEEKDWLGEGGEGKFDFSHMDEVNVCVTVAGGSVTEGDVIQWWDWIGTIL